MSHLSTKAQFSRKLVSNFLTFTSILMVGILFMSFNYKEPDDVVTSSKQITKEQLIKINSSKELPVIAQVKGGDKKKKKKDAFSGKSKKGPNIHSSKPPRTKSRSKLYSHSITKKKMKNKNNSEFASTKRRYHVAGKPDKGNGNSEKRGGRKKEKKSEK